MTNLSLLIQLIINYYAIDKRINVVQVYNCLNVAENAQLVKVLSDRGIISGIALTQYNYNIEESIFILKHLVQASSIGIIVDFNCNNHSEFLHLAANNELFNDDRYKWLILEETSNSGESNVIEHLNITNLFVNTEITFMNYTSIGNDSFPISYELYDIYNNGFNRGGKLNITFDRYFIVNEMGYGSLTESIIQRRTKYENRSNMSDITVQVAVISAELPWTSTQNDMMDYMVRTDATQDNTLVRFSAQCILMLKDVLGFNAWYTLFEKHTTNGTYGAALGAMYEGDIDYMLSGLFFTLARWTYITPVMTLCKFRAYLFFRTPKIIDVWGDDLFRPFAGPVWIAILITILIIAPLLKIALDWERNKGNYWKLRFGEKFQTGQESIVTTILIAFGAYCQQAAHLSPISFPSKCIYIFLFILSILIYNFYTSILVSTLVSGPGKTDITDVWKLADSFLTLRAEDIAYVRSYLEKNSDPQTRYLYDKKVKGNSSNIWRTTEVGLQLVRQGGYAFYSDAAIAYPAISKLFEPGEICDLNQIELRTENTLGMTLRKNSPYWKTIKIKLFRIREVGLLAKHQHYWLPAKPECMSNSYVFSVGMEYTAPIFIFLAISITTSMIILFMEIMHHRLMEMKHQQRHQIKSKSKKKKTKLTKCRLF